MNTVDIWKLFNLNLKFKVTRKDKIVFFNICTPWLHNQLEENNNIISDSNYKIGLLRKLDRVAFN